MKIKKNTKKKPFSYKYCLQSTLVALFVTSGISYANTTNVYDSKTKESFLISADQISTQMDDETNIELMRSISYLIAKHFYETKNPAIYDTIFMLVNDASTDAYISDIFNGKTYQEVIKLAKEMAKKDNITELNNSSAADFLYSYYSLALKQEKEPDGYNLLQTAWNAGAIISYSDFADDSSETPYKSKYITSEEFYTIQTNILEQYIKKNNFKTIKELEIATKNKIVYQDSYKENVISIRKFFYPQVNIKQKSEKIQKSINYMKKSLADGNYKNTLNNKCSVDNISYDNFKIVDTTINNTTFKTFDFNVTNNNTEMEHLQGHFIFKDNAGNYYLQYFSSKLNNPISKGTSQDIKNVVNTKRFSSDLLNKLTLYKINFKRCLNYDYPDFYSKETLEYNITVQEKNLKKINEKTK